MGYALGVPSAHQGSDLGRRGHPNGFEHCQVSMVLALAFGLLLLTSVVVTRERAKAESPPRVLHQANGTSGVPRTAPCSLPGKARKWHERDQGTIARVP